ncbi:MAG: ArsR family transcriptional regulator [Promethearchaeota archaeon]|nr:MAG: ArsR family transcriptional regulator [Candidatus Lokiarchaeota archaeon]
MNEISNYISEFLKAFSDQTRLDILYLVQKEPRTSADLQETLQKSQSTISQHLKILISNNLIIFEKKDKENLYSIKDSATSNFLSEVNTFVIQKNKEKLEDFIDSDLRDILP